jgi:hypothetical protein
MPQKPMMMLAALAMLNLMPSCATGPNSAGQSSNVALPVVSAAPIPSACTWLHALKPDAGFETRWTRAEKLQAVVLNRNIKNDCGR